MLVSGRVAAEHARHDAERGAGRLADQVTGVGPPATRAGRRRRPATARRWLVVTAGERLVVGSRLVVVEVVGGSRRAAVDHPGDDLRDANSSVIGSASMSIENGSVDGVAAAAKTKVPRMIQARCSPSALPETTPARFSRSTKSGISKETPKTSSIRVKKVKYSPNSTRFSSLPGVKPMSTSRPLGST